MKKLLLLLLMSTFLLSPALVLGAETHTFSANLYGANEVPAFLTTTSGTLSINHNVESNMFSYSLTINNADQVTAAHLHCGLPGQNGPVVAFLFGQGGGSNVSGTLQTSGSDLAIESSASSCSPSITSKADLVQALSDGRIYANAHSVTYPSGVMRGQLTPSVGSIDNIFNVNEFIDQMLIQNQIVINSLQAQHQALMSQIFGSL